ncbi:MAG TPA: hypothetical protein VGQ71_00250 [Terriglobales bacterium]|jgi:DNA-binding NarL/FixJ family response regulator|nr:hypothetical protein [Terriglobales bacterium]
MRPLNAVVAQIDARNAETIAALLHSRCRTVAVARSLEELRSAIPKNRADVVIVDLELADLRDIQELHHDFRDTCIVCTHRVADEDMWATVISAGAADLCANADAHGIVTSALRHLGLLTQAHAA